IPLSGVVSAMSYLLTICTKPNAAVAVQPPVYSPFYTIVQACEKTPVYNHLICQKNTYSIDFFNLEELFKTGVEAILFCNPHNPVGRVWSKAELRQLVDLCRKYDVLLISDEIHCDLALYKNQYTSMLKYAEIYDKIIVCTSPGKTFNIAGLHCANIFVPQADLRKKIIDWLEGRYIFAPNIFAMEACKAAYLNGFQWVDEQKRHLESNHKIITDFFSSGFPQAAIAPLEGTYLTWINLAYTGLTSAELVEAFAQSGAAVSAGKTFGERYDGYIRLNIAGPRRQLTEGLERIGKSLKNIK
ncbi:MAG: MalY/PatB family protein, partial [Lachnospiraceae bacterium]